MTKNINTLHLLVSIVNRVLGVYKSNTLEEVYNYIISNKESYGDLNYELLLYENQHEILKDIESAYLLYSSGNSDWKKREFRLFKVLLFFDLYRKLLEKIYVDDFEFINEYDESVDDGLTIIISLSESLDRFIYTCSSELSDFLMSERYSLIVSRSLEKSISIYDQFLLVESANINFQN